VPCAACVHYCPPLALAMVLASCTQREWCSVNYTQWCLHQPCTLLRMVQCELFTVVLASCTLLRMVRMVQCELFTVVLASCTLLRMVRCELFTVVPAPCTLLRMVPCELFTVVPAPCSLLRMVQGGTTHRGCSVERLAAMLVLRVVGSQ
jgi:hypothetical protein